MELSCFEFRVLFSKTDGLNKAKYFCLSKYLLINRDEGFRTVEIMRKVKPWSIILNRVADSISFDKNRYNLHTHTHTHTHIYIYIYIYARVRVCMYSITSPEAEWCVRVDFKHGKAILNSDFYFYMTVYLTKANVNIELDYFSLTGGGSMGRIHVSASS